MMISVCATSCGNGQPSSKQETAKAVIPNRGLELNQHQLQGIWGMDTLENADFEIIGDSLIYTEHRDTPYFFEIKGDSVDIDIDGSKLVWIVQRLNADSLVVVNEVGIATTYLRFSK